jgi:hypothetical protein
LNIQNDDIIRFAVNQFERLFCGIRNVHFVAFSGQFLLVQDS